ncbi:MAG: hypothetical protein KAT04_08520 [Methylococcales bacterium]|nr:hypothetical protein [Methylococcales bacterium]
MKKKTAINFKLVHTMFLVYLSVFNSVSAVEISGHIGIENLGFINNRLESEQYNYYLSGVLEPELYHEWEGGKQSLAFVPFYRYSLHDNRRTHFDIRELTWLKAANDWELRVGIRKDFWGVSESQHLVDIINQTDLVENSDTEDKLGQPMINLALINDWGTLDLYFLAGFRERTFPGREGRLRATPEINVSDAQFEKQGAQKHLAYAIRWSYSIGDWDIGLSHFYGTNRDPSFLATADLNGQIQIIPYYEMIHQTGVDIQLTQESWLWKLESIVRSGQGKTYYAGTGGFEYTFYSVFESVIDVGIVAEYLYDSRGSHAPVVFQDDFLVAFRLGFNDTQSTELLAGIIFDRTNNTRFFNVEASRRFGDDWKVELEGRFFSSSNKNDPAFIFRDEDHIRVEIRYYL